MIVSLRQQLINISHYEFQLNALGSGTIFFDSVPHTIILIKAFSKGFGPFKKASFV